MTRQTRFFVLGAGGLLVLGLCTGLFAYVNREAALAVSAAGPIELRYVPADASVVGYANIREVMLSDVRKRIRQLVPDGVGENELKTQLGLDIERDMDHMVASVGVSTQLASKGWRAGEAPRSTPTRGSVW